jgi:SAM-dependent methyltransferase
MRLYDDLAAWWPLLSNPSEYAPEAEFFHGLLAEPGRPAPRTVLELGSGGGNNASHLKHHYEMTLVDVSPRMLAVSAALNPECEHLEGDMRTLRIGRTFDAVFVHDAIMYMTSEADLRAALLTASVHCLPNGTAVFVPDYVRETFVATTDYGGHDGEERGARYLEWAFDPDPADTTYDVDFAVLLRDESGVRVVHDRQKNGLFARADWLRLLADVGFDARIVRDKWEREIFLATRRRQGT